jgi:hypothetical protein
MTNAMTRAWQIRKEAAEKFNCNMMDIIFDICLKMAWAEIKGDDTMTTEEIAKWIEKKVQSSEDYADTGFSEYWYKTNVNIWGKEKGLNRIYINMNYGRYCNGRSKWSRGVSYCIDLDKNKAYDCSRKYNNAGERNFLKDLAEKAIKLY